MKGPESGKDNSPVFFDDRGHRRRAMNYGGVLAAAIVTILAGCFVVSVLVNPFLPQLHLKPSPLLPSICVAGTRR